MFNLVYVSSAIKPFSKEELLQLLSQSRENNTRLGLTGILLYKDGNFMQVLEGEESTVRALFDKISRDPRHSGSIVLLAEPIEQRQFADWSMGFRNLNDPDVLALPGFNTFLNRPLDASELKEDPSICRELLKMFKL